MRAISFGVGAALIGLAGVGVLQGAERDRICVAGFASAHRPKGAAWEALRRAVYAREGKPYDHASYEVDHIVPLCLDGSNEMSNLQLQPWPEARVKDRLEGETCRAYCDGKISLNEARGRFLRSLP